ncbi:cytosolic arginine sensor for mTORC1 subunit 1-like [Rhopilema esculentum]|uniref:cytosolic arginine sensor for mTORC1 subunit 1-like n=1 Tax=Rhopilema esculentum TaxID=499914 RepID=UPI0031D4DB4A
MFNRHDLDLFTNPEFFSFTETSEDYTIIVTREHFEELPKCEKLRKSPDPWRALTVSVGEMGATELAGISKIAQAVICPLADQEIPVLVLSTYQSDYILVQQPFLKDAVECLATHFNVYNEYDEHISTSINKPTISKTRGQECAKKRPEVTSFVSPDTYQITGLDSAFFPSVVQVLLEMMFFTRFPMNALHTSSDTDCWRMIKIGDAPFDFETYGVVARVAEPLAQAGLSTYYISTYNYGHTLVYNQDLDHVLAILREHIHHQNFDEEPR